MSTSAIREEILWIPNLILFFFLPYPHHHHFLLWQIQSVYNVNLSMKQWLLSQKSWPQKTTIRLMTASIMLRKNYHLGSYFTKNIDKVANREKWRVVPGRAESLQKWWPHRIYYLPLIAQQVWLLLSIWIFMNMGISSWKNGIIRVFGSISRCFIIITTPFIITLVILNVFILTDVWLLIRQQV